MQSTILLFYIFSFFLVFSATMVIFTSHPVFALLYLVGSFLSASFLLFLLECELLALLFITIYVGAIAILFLFAVMMLEFKSHNLNKNLTKYTPVGIFFGFGLLIPLFNEISKNFPYLPLEGTLYQNNYTNWYDLIDSTSESEALGQVLYNFYVLQFLISGIILLVVLFGVVHLTNKLLNDKEEEVAKVGKQTSFKQLSKDVDLR